MDTTVKLWEVDTGREVRSFSGHIHGVYSVAFSPNGRYILSGSGDGSLKLWDLSLSSEVLTLSHPDGGALYGLAFSPDGKWLGRYLLRKRSSAGFPSGIAVYSLETKRFEIITDFGWGPVWLSDSRRLLFWYEDKIYCVDRDSKKIREISSVRPYSIAGYPSLRVSKDNRMLYYGLGMNEADIWLMTLQ
jgi:WD40 repeat protein